MKEDPCGPATCCRLGSPGRRGRPLMEAWAPRLKVEAFAVPTGGVDPSLLPGYRCHPVVRAMPGPQFEAFTEEARRQVFGAVFIVMLRSDRMGYRLKGPELKLTRPLEMISEAVAAGTVQVPPDGWPIIRMADRYTIGGYPKIAQVAMVDLPVLAQVRPGERVRFTRIELEEAQALLRKREREIRGLQVALSHVEA